ncbi:MAG: efflux RND transporter periplasmic adaptor subunit [Betaproteobacteria bacterium]
MKLSTTALSAATRRALALCAAVVLGAGALWTLSSRAQDGKGADAAKKAGNRPALTVTLVSPQSAEWPLSIAASGNVVAWQEAIIGAEISGFRVVEVLANVGDSVRRGQLLARISSDHVAADAAQARAGLAEAQAMLAEARANAERARQVQASGALSAQQISQYLTAEQTAQARVTAAQASVQAAELRLAQTRVLAPDDGVISARSAAVGSLAQPGQEMFRLIRGNRLEWRAEVTATELARIRPGMTTLLQLPGADARIAGKVRMVAPTVDPQTRNALVYVDLPAGTGARAGMFARGELQLGKAAALTLPQTAVVMRDGFSYAFRVGADNRVSEVKIEVGRRVGDRVEVVRGMGADTKVVASGVGVLAEGDLVRVTDAAPAAPAKAAPAAPAPASAPVRK